MCLHSQDHHNSSANGVIAKSGLMALDFLPLQYRIISFVTLICYIIPFKAAYGLAINFISAC